MKDFTYLDLLKRPLDPVQKKACCRTENTIVAAGAGSGKTQVLATRFAWLVMSCNIPASKILTLTFTKKAAAEMFARIYSTLKFFAGNDAVPEKERANAQKAIEEFSETHIQTLDSYCTSIVKQAANRYGISPDFSGDTKSSYDDVNLKALQFVFKHRENPAILYFSKLGGLQALAENYFAAAAAKISITTPEGYLSGKHKHQAEAIADLWNRKLHYLSDFCTTVKEMITAARPADASNVYLTTLSRLTADDAVPEFFEISDSTFIENDPRILEGVNKIHGWINEIISLKTTKRSSPFTELKDAINELAGNKELFSAIYFIKEYKYARMFFKLLDEFCTEQKKEKRMSGSLSFSDISNLALKILVEQKDIRTQEKNAYSKIMIDEFQDNNGKNRDMLYLLSEREDILTEFPELDYNSDELHQKIKDKIRSDKLFFVGDEKQSIYKFRDADVSVFNELKSDLNTTPLQMNHNYRSTNSLLSTFNQLFGGFAVSENDDTEHVAVFPNVSEELFEAAYPAEAQATKVNTKTYEELPPEKLTAQNVSAHVCIFNKDAVPKEGAEDYLSTENHEAFFVAQKIRKIYDAKKYAGEEINYSDFAVLDRTRDNRSQLINWLNRSGIPFNLDQQKNIFDEAPVNDIYNFLRLCVYTSDRQAFAAYLASPFAGLSESSLEKILAAVINIKAAAENDGKLIPFSAEHDGAIKAVLPESEYAKYRNAADFFNASRKQVLSQPLTKTISVLWNDCGYRYETLLNMNANLLAEQFDLLFELCRTTDEEGQNIAWFVDQLDRIRQGKNSYFKIQSDISLSETKYPVEKSDAVQVMTIHASKGLQFKYVFILGCMGAGSASKQHEMHMDPEYGLSIKSDYADNYFQLRLAEDDLAKTQAEYKRVFYVAVTRAENEVFITGAIKKETMIGGIISHYYEGEAEKTGDIPTEPLFNENAPFDFIHILPVKKDDAFAITQTEKNDETALIAGADKNYAAAPAVEKEEPESNRRTPSSLECEGSVIEDASLKDFYPELSETIKKYSDDDETSDIDSGEKFETEEDYVRKEDFSFADFGTLVHEYLCAQARGIPAAEYAPDVKLFKKLEEADKEAIIDTCRKMCAQFKASKLGKEFDQAVSDGRFAKAEYAFRMFDAEQEIFYTGSIDLIYGNADGTFTIVDYKSDSKLNDEKYIPQQKCYRKAAAKLLNADESKFKCRLYYLRFDRIQEI